MRHLLRTKYEEILSLAATKARLITINDLLFHLSGHNNDLLVQKKMEVFINVLAPQPSQISVTSFKGKTDMTEKNEVFPI